MVGVDQAHNNILNDSYRPLSRVAPPLVCCGVAVCCHSPYDISDFTQPNTGNYLLIYNKPVTKSNFVYISFLC